jgi:hypothetical protein
MKVHTVAHYLSCILATIDIFVLEASVRRGWARKHDEKPGEEMTSQKYDVINPAKK